MHVCVCVCSGGYIHPGLTGLWVLACGLGLGGEQG